MSMFNRALTAAETPEGFLVATDAAIVDAGVSVTDRKYFQVEQGGTRLWLPAGQFSPTAEEAARSMKQAGMLLFGRDSVADLGAQAKAVNRYRQLEIVEHTGHFHGCFGYPDGRVFTGDGRSVPVAYPAGLVCVEARGTLKQFKRKVLGALKNQHIPLFAACVPYASCLLSLTGIQGNYLIMFSGPKSRGKTTTAGVMAAVCGPVLDSQSGQRYLRKFNSTQNAFEEELKLFRDLPAIADELSSFGTMRERQEMIRTLVHHVSGVDAKRRMGGPVEEGSHVRTIVTTTSNDQGRELLARETGDAAEAVTERLIEIPVPRGTEGVFNAPHPGFKDTAALAAECNARLGKYYGTAMPVFLKQLMIHQADPERNLRSELQQRIDKFKALPEVLRFGPLPSRVTDFFGLIYAAGRLAKFYKVMPSWFDPGTTVVYVLGLYLGNRVEIDPVQQVFGWMGTHKLYDLREGRRPALSDKSFAKKGAFIDDGPAGAQLLMNKTLLDHSFKNPTQFKKRLHAMGLLQADGRGQDRHYGKKRTVRRNHKPERVAVFDLPDLDEWLENNGYPAPKRRRR